LQWKVLATLLTVMPMSPSDAAARLRYVSGVRTRARRAALLPSWALLAALGVVLATHGVLTALWPHRPVVALAWLAAIVVVRPALRRAGPDIRAAAWLWAACAAAALAGMVVADAAGTDPLIAAIAAALALRCAFAGLPLAAIAVLGAGLVVEALAPGPAAEIALGAAMIVAGLAVRRRA
jgi:hypothetical protein